MKIKEEEMLATETILNKSDLNLELRHKVLLYKGLNFVTTPKWCESTKNQEWLNLQRHIRSCEWSSVFRDDESNNSDNFVRFPEKLKITKFNRPEPDLVEEKIQVYCEMTRSKVRNLKEKVNYNYYRRCNLDYKLKIALQELKGWVKNNKIVICKADKDGRILVVNYEDYQLIMRRELSNLNQLENLNQTNINHYFESIRDHIQKQLIDLHKEGSIDDDTLLHVAGTKNKNEKYYKVTGSKAKYFANNEAAYSYPLFKTHKIDNVKLHQTNIFEIPTRLLQSAGNITTSRATSFLEMILQPISVMYCAYKIDEYCRDSKSYLEILDAWKKDQHCNSSKQNLFLVAADVQALYPSVRRHLVRDGVRHALKLCSNYNQKAINILVDLTMFCLENVVVRNEDKFYNQTDGIITGDNHSVSVANITLHFIILEIADQLNKTILFKRYIDDLMMICSSESQATTTQQALKQKFEENDLRLTFRMIQTADQDSSVEFLDVNHVVDAECTAGFYTTNFIKPTAQNRTFLNGRSYHPRSTFKSIIYSEAIRLRRLNERHDIYLQSIESLKTKCLTSSFDKKIVRKMTQLAKTWTARFRPPSPKKDKRTCIWATSFPSLLKLSGKERALNPKALITYKRPQTLGQQLTRFKSLARGRGGATDNQGAGPCKHCSLCGNHGRAENMVESAKTILLASGKQFHLRSSLTCKDWGIYVAICQICEGVYVGQTSTSFSKRWNSHRATWRRSCKGVGDQAALRVHYDTQHQADKDKELPQAFRVIFVDQPDQVRNLDLCESLWVNRLQASININRTLLPKIT